MFLVSVKRERVFFKSGGKEGIKVLVILKEWWKRGNGWGREVYLIFLN